MMAQSDSGTGLGKESSKMHPYPLWSPRFWHGMRFGDWMCLLAENRFRIHPIRWVDGDPHLSHYTF